MPRILALLIGTSLAAMLVGGFWWIRSRPERTQQIEIHVADAHGRPVESFGWEIWDETPGAILSRTTPEASHPGATAIASVLAHGVKIEVRAKGLGSASFGPFEPGTLPKRIDAVIPDRGVVSGSVTHAGKRVAGATVALVCTSPDVMHGVPSGLFYGFGEMQVTSNEAGEFRIPSEFPSMQYFVRAWNDGFAATTVGPVHVGDPAIEVQLNGGGAIDGLLRLSDARDPGGTRLELYRIEPALEMNTSPGERFVALADHDGRFQFVHLDAGPWLIRLLPTDETRHESAEVPLDNVPLIVDVAEHETTRIEMDLSRPIAQLDGKLTLNGNPWSSAYVYLYVVGERALLLDVAHANEVGNWTLRARAPGRYRVVVQGNHEHAIEPERVSRVMDLTPGSIRWERELTWSSSDDSELVLDR